jgi:zinc/manganese transport system substrate-binding protein
MNNLVIGFRNALLCILIGGFIPLAAQHQHQHQHRHQHRYHGGEGDGGLNIVCSFSDYASIAEYLAGPDAQVQYIAHGEQDPHFVAPKPSYAMMLNKADMWITTGMDLEIWSTTLLDKARNRQIMDGETGFVSVSDGVTVLQKADKVDRTEGDIHLMGNPHINTGPLNWKVIALNIATGLIKVDPANSDYYRANLEEFKDMVDRALFGDELVDIFGGETLSKLLDNKTLFTFLEKDYQGEKLINKLGGWLKKAEPFRGKKIIAYHKNWAYFTETFGLEIVGYIEPKPGIPPSAKHVQQMIQIIEEQQIKLMLVASYFEKNSPQSIADKTGIVALYLPLFVGALPEIKDNFQLVDYWIDQINKNIK